MTTAGLRWVGALFGEGPADERRFRPNLVIEAEGAEPLERDWVGSVLAIGETRLRVVKPTTRCRMIGLAQSELPVDKRLLRRLGRETDAQFGVYAELLEGSEVRRGDPVELLDAGG